MNDVPARGTIHAEGHAMKKLAAALAITSMLVASVSAAATYTAFVRATARPGQLTRYEFDGPAHEDTTFTVKGTGGDIDCYLYTYEDKKQRFVSRDTSDRDGCQLTMTPARETHYWLLVQNCSDHDEAFTILVQ